MLFRKFLTVVLFLVMLPLLSACDDLHPSSEDKRPPVVPGTPGSNVGQLAPNFSLFDTLNNVVTPVPDELIGADGIVLYFTMWCPICDSHMSHMRSTIIPLYPNVKFYFVDYVSGTVELSRSAQVSNGYTGNVVLVDDIQHVLNLYDATMGTTVVIDNSQIVQMNEDYKDGTALNEVLAALP